MDNSNLIRKIQMECPLCDKVHEVEERIRNTKTIIKGETIDYEETYYYCRYSVEGENEFATGKMENNNLLNARNAYRMAHNLLTSDEIIKIRGKYALSQADFAKLLGWGEATISRYESKAIQDEAYDNMLRLVRDNPLVAYALLRRNSEKFSGYKKLDIKRKVVDNLDETGKEYLQRQALESEYVNYQEPCDANGFRILDIDKLELIVSYFAKRINYLYKVKLVKMLWYADSLYFKRNNISMTGLVYCHDNLGALPIGHYKMVGLDNIHVKEEEDFDHTKYRFLPNEKMNETGLSNEEKKVLDMVIKKFKSYKSTDIVAYMHEEIAYQNTEDGDVIPFSLAKEIRDF